MKPTRAALSVLASLLSIVALSGCGGGGGNGGPGPGGGVINTGDAAFDRRITVSKAVSDLYDTLPHTDIDDENRKILALLQARPEIEAAGQAEPGSVWARFKDTGEVFVVINNGAVTHAEITRGRAARNALPRGRGPSGRAATELPNGQKIYLFNNMGANSLLSATDPKGIYQNGYLWARASAHNLALQQMLKKSSGANYGQTTSESGTPAALKNVKDAEGLYLYGHAGLGIDRSGRAVFVLNTAQPTVDFISPFSLGTSNLAVYKSLIPDIVAGRVGMSLVVDGQAGDLALPDRKLTMKPYYYITPDFVRHYMTFKPDTSFVFVNGCRAADPSLAADLMAAFKEKRAAVFASWDGNTNAEEAMDTADLLLSGMAGEAVGLFTPDPPQRPFSYPELVAAMKNLPRPGKGYSFAQSSGHKGLVNLVMAQTEAGGAKFGMLAPSIRQMDEVTISLDKTELRIRGRFGERRGRVTVNGGEIAVTEWTHSLIKATLPPHDDPRGHGDVVVEVDGHKSPPAQLSLYTFNIRLEDQAKYDRRFLIKDDPEEDRKVYGDPTGSHTKFGNLTIWGRAHVQDTRATPYQNEPFDSWIRQLVLTSADIGTRKARVESYSASGSATLELSSGRSGVFETLTMTYAPDGAGPVKLDGTNAKGNVASIHGTVDLKKREIGLYFHVWVEPAVKIDVKSNIPSGSRIPLGTTDVNFIGPITIPLSAAGDIVAGSKTFDAVEVPQGGTLTRKLSWTGSISSRPKPDNPRSARR